jgi:hypothetical protein
MPILPALMGLPVGGGNVFWVDSGYTGGASDGSFKRPFITLERMFNSGKLTASNGDVVYLKPGHTETIATATTWSFDLAGVSVIGLGVGAQRPLFTFTTATTSTIPVSVADAMIANCVFSANFDSVVAVFTLTAAVNFTLVSCKFKDTSATDVSFVNLVDTSTVDNAADGLTILGCEWLTEDNASATVLKADATVDSVRIEGCRFNLYGAAANAGTIAIVAADKQLTNLVVKDNVIRNQAVDAAGILITGTCASSHGVIARNYVQSLDAQAAAFLAAGTTPIMLADNWYSGALAEPRAINTVGGTIYNDA